MPLMFSNTPKSFYKIMGCQMDEALRNSVLGLGRIVKQRKDPIESVVQKFFIWSSTKIQSQKIFGSF